MNRHRGGGSHRRAARLARDVDTSGRDEHAGAGLDSALGRELVAEATGEVVRQGDEHGEVRGGCGARGGLHGGDSTLAAAVLVLKVIAVSIVLGLVVGIVLGWGSVVVVEVK